MKLEALDHPKTFDLSARLDVSMPTTVGLLEFFWAFVAKKSPRGDVGKWPDGAIARACFYDGDPEHFINAMVDSGFVARSDAHRLVVHDWADHMPRWVKAKLAKANETPVDTDGTRKKQDCSADCSSDCSADCSIYSVREGKGREGKSSSTGTFVFDKKVPIPSNFCVSDRVRQWAAKNGHGRLEDHLENFVLACEKKGYKYKNWDSALMGAIREDWAKINGKPTPGSDPYSLGVLDQ